MGQPILEVEHLKKSYVNNVPILDDVSFSLQKGEVVVILLGPTVDLVGRIMKTRRGVEKQGV